MGNYLEYRPQLEYKRKLQAILDPYDDELLDENVEDAETFPQEEPPRIYIHPSYTSSDTLQEAIEITPTDILVSYSQAKHQLKNMIRKIVDNLRTKVTISPSVDEYIKAKEENDMSVIDEFERKASEINGAIEAEVLPILLDFQNELEIFESFIGPYLFPDALSHDMEYLVNHIEQLRQEEEKTLSSWVQQEQQERQNAPSDTSLPPLDYDEIRERNHILYFLSKQMEQVLEFVEEADGMIFQNSGNELWEQVYGLLGRFDPVGRSMKDLVFNRYEYYKQNLIDAHQRMKRLVDPSYKIALLQRLTYYQNLKLESKKVLDFVYAVDSDNDGDTINLFVMDLLDEIERTIQTSDNLLKDLYRVIEMERLQTIDYLASLAWKERYRRLYHDYFIRF